MSRPLRTALRPLALVLALGALAGCSSLPGREDFEKFTETPLADAEVMPTSLQRQRPKVLVLQAEENADRLVKAGQLGAGLAKGVTQILATRSIDVVENDPSPQLLEALRQAEAAGASGYEGPAVADVAIKPVISQAAYQTHYTPPGFILRRVPVPGQPQAGFAPAPTTTQQTTTTTTSVVRPVPRAVQQQAQPGTPGKDAERREAERKEAERKEAERRRAQSRTTTTTTTTTTVAPAQVAPQPQQYMMVQEPTPANFRHTASLGGSLQVYAMPSLKLLASIPLKGGAQQDSPSQGANDGTGIALLQTATTQALEGSHTALLSVFAPKGYITSKRTREDKTLFQISLGSQDGLRKGDTVVIHSVRKQAALFDGSVPPDEEVPVARCTVTEMVATTTAWVYAKSPEEARKVRRGDVAKQTYNR